MYLRELLGAAVSWVLSAGGCEVTDADEATVTVSVTTRCSCFLVTATTCDPSALLTCWSSTPHSIIYASTSRTLLFWCCSSAI